MNPESVTIFSDGASRGNPGPGGWAAIIISPKEKDNSQFSISNFHVAEIGGSEKKTTNNRMELTAAIEALLRIKDKGSKSALYTDSSYVINGITKWILGWKQNGWKTREKKDVLNADLWQKLDAVRSVMQVSFRYIGGHVGVVGNERADYLATAFADGKTANLFSGPLTDYPLKNILDVSADGFKIEMREKGKDRSRSKAYSYVSEIRGEIKVHKTWAECEVRVKNVPGAKYRKALSPEEESLIISAWRSGKRPEL